MTQGTIPLCHFFIPLYKLKDLIKNLSCYPDLSPVQLNQIIGRNHCCGDLCCREGQPDPLHGKKIGED